MEKHVTLVAVLNIGLGALGVFAALLVFFILTGSGIISGDPDAFLITTIIGTAVGVFLLIISLPGIIAAAGLLRFRPWARILMLIIAFLNLLHIPLGTALGIYTLWVLMQDETIKLFYPAPQQQANPET